MIPFKLPLFFLVSFLPIIIGFAWYHPALFGNKWLREAGLTPEQLEGRNMIKVLGLVYLLSFLFCFALQFVVIHQYHIYSIFEGEVGIAEKKGTAFNDLTFFMERYGTKFRTFGHGLFHGVLHAVFTILPILGINAIFERKSWKYILIHLGYWTLTAGIIGGLICQFNG